MLSFENDIYKRIMKPIGLKYYVSSDRNMDVHNFFPKNNALGIWQFIFPNEINALWGNLSAGKLSSINTKKFEKKHVPTSDINNVKLAFSGNSRYLKNIYDS